jgi:threonyl-tRNA synthetase
VLWKISGHWDHYRDDMFVFKADEEDYCVKPMDCPFNILIYKTGQKSYRDLPIRYTEIGHVFRNEKSGELNGLFRVREITQDDSHLLVREDQVLTEVNSLLEMVSEYYAKLGLQPEYFLSTRPDDFMGKIEVWNKAEADLIAVLEKREIEYALKEKDGAFYGPKIDVNIKDSLGRSWQVATVQLDFQMPGRFGCEYIDREGQKQVPVMIHAAIFGSYERMIGILLEHYAGKLPWWLAPVQVRVLPVSEKFNDGARRVKMELERKGCRVEVDESNERLPAKIRQVHADKIPAQIVVGQREMDSGEVRLEVNKDQMWEEREVELAPEEGDKFVYIVGS